MTLLGGDAMKEKFIEMLHFRHACKSFDASKKISGADFEFILEAGRLSPSSFGFEPWRFLVVENPALREALKAHTWGGQKQIPTCSHFLVVLAMKAPLLRYDSAYIAHIMTDIKHLDEDARTFRRGLYENFQKNDFDLYGNDRAVFDWACRQTYLGMANMMLAAAAVGVDTCPIEGFDQKEIDKTLARDFRVDLEQYGVSYMLAFGYRVKDATPKTRRPLEDFAVWFK